LAKNSYEKFASKMLMKLTPVFLYLCSMIKLRPKTSVYLNDILFLSFP
jgi:hypothetical protein